MQPSPDALTVFVLAIQAAVVLALMAGAIAGLLASLDGAPAPRALLRAGAAFGAALTLLTALLALGVHVVT